MYKTIFVVLQMLYAQMLRALIVKAVDNPEEEWDDFMLSMLDRLFDYKAPTA